MDKLTVLFGAEKDSESSLAALAKSLLERQPKLRRREVAEQLQVSEAALIEGQCGVKSQRLKADFAKIIQALPNLGYIMTLTRNNSAIHERKGIYDNVSIKGPMGLVITDDRKIDLRIFINRWASGFAVQEPIKDGYRYSLQFFDQEGVAIQKIFLQGKSDVDAYKALVEEFSDTQAAPLSFSAFDAEPASVDSSQVDRQALIDEWQGMTNVHQFFNMLKKYKISREQAFAIVGEPLAQSFDPASMGQFFVSIAKAAVPIMCFVGNRGNIQIHTGAIKTIKKVGPWLNILDAEFNLHLLERNVASAWLVRKPTVDGNVTSIELYDSAGETIVQFFGQRLEGQAENPDWRDLAEALLEKEPVT